MDPGSSMHSLSVLLSAMETSLKKQTALSERLAENARLIFHLARMENLVFWFPNEILTGPIYTQLCEV